MSLGMAAVMALQMILAILTATAGVGMQLHLWMMLADQGFGMNIRGQDDIAQYEHQSQECDGEPLHDQAILLKNRVPGKNRCFTKMGWFVRRKAKGAVAKPFHTLFKIKRQRWPSLYKEVLDQYKKRMTGLHPLDIKE